MNNTTSSVIQQSSEITPEVLNEILQNIDKVALELASKVEVQNAWDYFWLSHYNGNKVELAKAAEVWKELPENEKVLFQIIFNAHDIGRYQEALWELDTLRPWARHWEISAQIIKDSGILNSLSQDEQNTIIDAIKFHSEKDVDLAEDSTEYKLCYILRDFDKKKIINDEKFLSDEWIYWELKKHYFWSKLDEKYNDLISKLIASPETEIDDSNENELKLKELLSRWVNPISLNEFTENKNTTLSDINYSYATYMLNTISMIFDISNNDVLVDTINSPMFKNRFSFIKARVDEEEYSKILDTVKTYLHDRLTVKWDIPEETKQIINNII